MMKVRSSVIAVTLLLSAGCKGGATSTAGRDLNDGLGGADLSGDGLGGADLQTLVDLAGADDLGGTIGDAAVVDLAPPPSCVPGAAGDVPGFTALCSGKLTDEYTQVVTTGTYTYEFVYGAPFPGAASTTAHPLSINVTGDKFVSIPFTIGSSTNYVEIGDNDTFTKHPITFSISTAPGLFNDGTTSADVLVVKTRDPNIVFGAAPNPPAGWLQLDPNRRYFFNMIFAVYNKTAGAWNATCTDAGDPCKSGFTRYVTQ